MSTPSYRPDIAAPESCPSCIAWYAEFQRASLLLERLAEDRFPDQATFDAWQEAQMRQVFRRPAPTATTEEGT